MSNAVGMAYQMGSYCHDFLGGLYHVKETVIGSQEVFLEG